MFFLSALYDVTMDYIFFSFALLLIGGCEGGLGGCPTGRMLRDDAAGWMTFTGRVLYFISHIHDCLVTASEDN